VKRLPKRILIIGGSGFVGAKLAKLFVADGHKVAITYATHPLDLGTYSYQVDLLSDWKSFHHCLADFAPDIVVHCAISTAESNAAHHRVSVESVEHIIRHIDPSALLIYFSTNAVFNDGGPHSEAAIPKLRQDRYRIYGATRAQGEKLILQSWSNALVIRTDTVNGYDVRGILNRRLADVVESLQRGEAIKRFQDRFITPTLVDNLVEATVEMCRDDFTYRGLIHIAGSERLTDYEFTCLLAQYLKVDTQFVEPQLMSDNPDLSSSPRDNSLDVSKAQSLLKTPLLDVRAQFSRLFP
jgi:dTDP-4-dehydrorhamnose reductase